jgi:structure-specific endonuclease subunit SLX1
MEFVEKVRPADDECYVYLLVASDGSTYVGATVDLDRRLRQHNKEIKGGAFATSAKVVKGEQWVRAAHVSGFPTWQAALQFEWRWKQLTRKLNTHCMPLKRRFLALDMLLSLDRSTSKAIPYTEWHIKPQVHIEVNCDDFLVSCPKVVEHCTL